jgi:sugar/nucleoside kinase (ribokinase family)
MEKHDISIVGEINLDLILYGLPTKLPTERELLGNDFRMTLGSSSAILAHNLAVLGSKVGFVTKVGNDILGSQALDRVAASGADVSHVVRTSRTGSGVTIILPHGRERHILTYLGMICELRFEDLDLEYLASARHFHMSSLFLHRAMLDQIPELFRTMKSRGLSTSLDTNDDPDDRWDGVLSSTLPHVDVLLPNERETRRISGMNNLHKAISALAERVPTVVVKMGAKGALAARGRERFQSPSIDVEVVDTVGAGDSFNAGFLHQYLKGADLRTCLHYGNLAGAFSTTACGGTEAFCNRVPLQKFLTMTQSRQRSAPRYQRRRRVRDPH